MKIRRGALSIALLWAATAALSQLGVFEPLDRAITELRFSAADRAPTGQIVVLDIDSESLEAVGVWPWPRSVYAKVLDTLGELGSAEVAFDVDFSSRSDEVNDASFAEALEAAGGYAMLAAFQQVSGAARSTFVNLPLERFRQHAMPAGVNVITDANGIVHSFPAAMVVDGVMYPSMAAALSGVEPTQPEVFIDFGINARSIDRISLVEVLNGTVDPIRVLNKQVVIGASALELRDIFSVPRFGTLPGPVLQVLAAETLKQGRGLLDWGSHGPLLIAAAIAGVLMIRQRLGLTAVGAGAASVTLCFGVEVLALVLQSGFGIIVRTLALHAAELAYVIAMMAREVATRRKLHQQVMRERDVNRMILDRVISDNFDGVVVVDETGTIVTASRLAEGLLGGGRTLAGCESAAVLPAAFHDAVLSMLERAAESAATAPHEVELHLSGRRYDFEYTVTVSTLAPSEEDDVLEQVRHVACLTFHDITERRQDERRLTYLATHDALTGALSRERFVERLGEILGSPSGRESGLSILLLDLTRFRLVNETLGHAHGDTALKEAFSRLARTEALVIARMGGDHFALALGGALSDSVIAELCDTILQEVTRPYMLGEHRAVLGARIGVTTTAISGLEPEHLLSHADMALSAAKASSGNVHSVFTPSMDATITEKQAMEVALRAAISLSQLWLVYQPQVELSTGQLCGVEALVRWHHPSLGVIPPAKFIPLAEETGLIVELGRWILAEACREFAAWPAHVKLAVNISPVQFELSDVAADVAEALAQSGLTPGQLDIEITEGVFVSTDSRAGRALAVLRDTGVGVALDDFGTGYSSLSYLGRLPIDKIKIDQSFVRSLPGDSEAEAIVTAVLALSRSLGKVVIAEGIETEAQLHMLRSLGCCIGQGYLFGRPQSADSITGQFLPAVQPQRLALAG